MLTITKLAKKYGLSRTTLLYYEKEGLISAASRSESGYRYFGEKEEKILAAIVRFRSFGLSIDEIKLLLTNEGDNKQKQVLRAQFDRLEIEIEKLKLQQLAIVKTLGDKSIADKNKMTKEKWTEIMKASGMKDQDMKNWHIQFERSEPHGHQEFLESLQINEEEIKTIRTWSQKG